MVRHTANSVGASRQPRKPGRKPAKSAYQAATSADPDRLRSPRSQLEALGVDLPHRPTSIGFNPPPAVHPPPRQPRRRPVPKQRSRRWNAVWVGSALWLLAFAVSAGLGMQALQWLTRLPSLPDCQRMSFAAADGDRLHCAREAARQSAQTGDLKPLLAGVELVHRWSPNHPLYAEAQELLAQWSQSILAIAEQRLAQNDLADALNIAQAIPPSSPSYPQAQEAIADWQTQWQQGETLYATALTALRQQNWALASEQLVELGKLPHDYWHTHQMNALTSQIVVEQTAWQSLDQARQAAAKARPESWQAAIALAQKISPQSVTWDAARVELQQWSQALLDIGLQRWREGDVAGAVAIGQDIPSNLELPAEQQHLVRYSHAQALARWDATEQVQPSWGQVWRLQEAIAAVQPIPASSPFYVPAQVAMQSWREQLQDVQQLQVASAVASLGHRPAYELAIAQANQLDTTRPRRLQAQTLISAWNQEIQRLDDLPLLNYAQTLAQSGNISALQAAIAAAQQVPQSRALWQDAQAAIATWTSQIQTVQDQPILAEAEELAQAGNLRQAMRTATKIERGRALYEQAKTLIGQWQATLTQTLIAEDRKLLDAATAQATRQHLSEAIGLASQIASDRPLYREAQDAIARWQTERAAIWSSWESQSAPEFSDPVTSDTLEGSDANLSSEDPAP